MKRSYCSCDKLTEQDKRSWFERFLMLVLPHFDIIKTSPCLGCGGTGDDCWDCLTGDDCWDCFASGKVTSLYLRRFYIWRSSWIGKNWGDLYLHKIARSDDDPDPHDHPWDFRTFVLKGGYTDEAYFWRDFPKCWNEGPGLRSHWADDVVKAPATRFRPYHHIHRVILPDDKPAWTLVLTSGYRKTNGNADWNFVTVDRKVPWREYLGLNAEDEHGS